MGLDQAVVDAVQTAVARGLAPLEARLAEPVPMTYTVRQTAIVVGCSERTIYQLVEQGRLPIVPHLGKKVVIPRVAVEAFVLANVGAQMRAVS